MIYVGIDADSVLLLRTILCRTNPVLGAAVPNGAIRRESRALYLTYFIATPPGRGWQRNEGLLPLHSCLSLDIFSSVFDTLGLLRLRKASRE